MRPVAVTREFRTRPILGHRTTEYCDEAELRMFRLERAGGWACPCRKPRPRRSVADRDYARLGVSAMIAYRVPAFRVSPRPVDTGVVAAFPLLLGVEGRGNPATCRTCATSCVSTRPITTATGPTRPSPVPHPTSRSRPKSPIWKPSAPTVTTAPTASSTNTIKSLDLHGRGSRQGQVAGNAIMHTDRGSQYHSPSVSERTAAPGDPSEHESHRLVPWRCRRRVLLRHDQGGNRRRIQA